MAHRCMPFVSIVLVSALSGASSGSAQISTVGAFLLDQNLPGVNGTSGNADRFGHTVAAGDFNGDGISDLAVGVPGEFTGSSDASGAVHVFPGAAAPFDTTGDLILHQDTAGIPGSAEANDQFGSVLVVGDFDGDGFDDLAVGSQFEDVGSAVDAGAVWVLFGSVNGLTATGSRAFDQNDFGWDETPEASDAFGFALAAGDFNQDGLDDLAIGAPFEDLLPWTTDGGTIHVIGSSAGSALAQFSTWTQGEVDPTRGSWDPTPAETPENDDTYGFALASGDFDHDGRDDLAVAARGETFNGATQTGLVEVLFGSDQVVPFDTSRHSLLHQDRSGAAGACESGDLFGGTLAVGDFDADGLDDLVVGVAFEDIGSVSAAGAVSVFFGPFPQLSSLRTQFFSQDDPTAIVGAAETNDHFGSELTVGDFNDDGFDDLVVGVPDEDIGTVSNAGLINILYGRSVGLGSTGNQGLDQNSAGVPDATETLDFFGGGLAAGDFNGDGVADLAVGVSREELPDQSTDHGVVSILFGQR